MLKTTSLLIFLCCKCSKCYTKWGSLDVRLTMPPSRAHSYCFFPIYASVLEKKIFLRRNLRIQYIFCTFAGETQEQKDMPTLFIIFCFRFLFYSNDHEPIHVHVIKDEHEARFQVEPEAVLLDNKGLKISELPYGGICNRREQGVDCRTLERVFQRQEIICLKL